MVSVADDIAPFVMVPVALVEQVERGELPPRALMAYVAIARHVDWQKAPGLAFPSQARIGALMGASERTAKRAVSELLAAGWIRKTRQPETRRGRYSVNAYVVLREADPPRVTETRRPADQVPPVAPGEVPPVAPDQVPPVAHEVEPRELEPRELEQLALFDSSPEMLEADTDGCAVEAGKYDTGEVCERCGNGVRRASAEHGDIDPICADCHAELRADGLAGARELYRIVGDHRSRNTSAGRRAQRAVSQAPFMQPGDTP